MRFLGPPLVPKEAVERIGWFIRLRWMAAAGVLLFVVVGRFLMGLGFPVAPYVVIALVMALYNAVFFVIGRRGRWGSKFAVVQVMTDHVALTALMHFGGGIENPFLFYYLFHTIIACVLFRWRKVIVQVVLASALITWLAIAEYTGLIVHQHVEGLFTVELYSSFRFVMVIIFAFVTTLSITAFLAASIAERLRERSRELEQANALLEDQDRVKSQYVMRVAHDLAEPAGMITSCLKVVTEGLAGPVSDKAMDMLQRAQNKGEYIGNLVRDLLSLSRIKAVKEVPKTQVRLSEVVDQVFEDVELLATKKKVTLEKEIPEGLPAVYGNAEAIYELFGNLVTNAVKYTLVGGRVTVIATNIADEVMIKVDDNGVGIPPEAIPHIFEEFYRADNVKAEAVEGTGLGLSIVSHILEAHDGSIRVESQEGKGTTFSFTLPVAWKTDA